MDTPTVLTIAGLGMPVIIPIGAVLVRIWAKVESHERDIRRLTESEAKSADVLNEVRIIAARIEEKLRALEQRFSGE